MSITYIVSKLLTYSALPPSIFIITLFVAAFYAKKYRFFFFFMAISFYALSNNYVANALLSPLEKPYNTPLPINKELADAVVVLSGGSVKGASNLPLSDETYKRAMWGIILAKQYNLPLLFSGTGTDATYRESDAFLASYQALNVFFDQKNVATSPLNVKTFSIHVENSSLDTYENAKLSKAMFEDMGIPKPCIYLVTSAYHMERSKRLYEHFGFCVIPAATSFKISQTTANWIDLLPNIWALEKSYKAIHEYIGLASLKLRGI